MESKRNSETNKKTVLDALDEQMRQKEYEKEKNKIVQMETDIKNLQYQYYKHDNRPHPQDKFRQN